jgi:hypothetical protein
VALRQAYRAWRAEQLVVIEQKSASPKHSPFAPYEDADDGKNAHPWRQARGRLMAFRDEVIGELHWQPDLDQMPMMRLALGIPSYVPMTRRWWMIVLWMFFVPFIPIRLRMLGGRALLRRIRTFQGREYVFTRLVAPVWSIHTSYSSGIDCVLHKLPLARHASTYSELVGFERADVDVLMRLGLNDVSDIPDTWGAVRRSYEPTVIHALIDEGVLERVDELGSIPTRNYLYASTPTSIGIADLRAMTRILMSADMPRARIPEILERPYDYNAAQLSAVLTLLRARGIADIEGMFDAIGSRLWHVDEGLWRFVLDTIGARTPNEVKRFRQLLDLSCAAPAELVTWMRAHGASLDDLANAREFLVQVSKIETSPVARFDRLVQCGLSVSDVVHCKDYVLHGQQEDLCRYLDVLTKHGYHDRNSILAFHAEYAAVATSTLDHLLTLVGPLNDRTAATAVATWIMRARRRAYMASLEYVLNKMPAMNIEALNQRLFVMNMCPALVRYMVEEQGLNDPRALYDWYYGDAWGAKDYAGDKIIDDAERVLIEDAFHRKNFTVLEGNRRCLDEIISERVRGAVSAPIDHTDEGLNVYHEARRQAASRERNALKAVLASVLKETHGVLLRSLLETASHPASSIPKLLATLRPLMADVARGRGPVDVSLTDLEAEAIAVTYGVTTASIREYWTRIRVDDTAWQSWYRDEPYFMRWQRNTCRISESLDHAGLEHLAVAAQFARRFGADDVNVFDASKHLRAKLLANPLVDHHMLSRHLGVLLAAAADDELVKEWVSQRLEALSSLDDESAVAHREIGELNDFFRVTLPDALDARMEHFVSRFNNSDARHLSLRLDANTPRKEDGQAMLFSALGRTREKALQIYQRWSTREKRKFKTRADGSHQSTLHAFVSKFPAAFFAKQAAGLCSWGNSAMWEENRNAHLVVFDPLTGKLAGMALLYVEAIKDIDPTRPSLIIRAINPTVAMVANHDPHSVVGAYFDLAIELAREHGLAGVAFPPGSGQDFMSNRIEVSKVIRKCYEERAVPLYRYNREGQSETMWRDEPREVQQPFSAYEEGNGRVSKLYAIWRASDSTQYTTEPSQALTA